MKKALALLLCLATVLMCFAGCGEKKANNKSTVLTDFTVKSVEDLEKMREDTKHAFSLQADIDFKGEEWEGFEKFAGSLNGMIAEKHNYKISNFVIKPSKGDNLAGFINNLTGEVSNVDFENVTIELPDGFKGDVGVLAGTCETDVVNVNVRNVKITGKEYSGNLGTVIGSTDSSITDSFSGGKIDVTVDGDSNIGAIVGYCADVSGADVETSIKVQIESGKVNLGGIAADANSVSDSVFDGAIECKAKKKASAKAGAIAAMTEMGLNKCYSGATKFKTSGSVKKSDFVVKSGNDNIDCYKRDISNLDSKNLSKKEYNVRKKVVDYVEKATTMRWMPKNNMYFVNDKRNGETQFYGAGEWFFGLPFTYNGGSVEAFEDFLDENNVTTDDMPETGWENIIGGTIAQIYYWATTQVTDKTSFSGTGNMVLRNGLIPSGEYTYAPEDKTTAAIVEKNSKDTILEAYAQTKLGDIIIKMPGDHAYVITEAPHVVRNKDGKIDPDASYFIYDTQEAQLDRLANQHTMCVHHNKATFSYAYSYSYLPFKIEAFDTCKKRPAEKITSDIPDEVSLSALQEWTVSSNYRINYVTLVIKDGKKEIVNHKFYPIHNAYSNSINPFYLLDENEKQLVEQGKKYDMIVYVDGEKDKNQVKFKLTA